MSAEQLTYNNTVSIAKGIGILLMVVGHSGCPSFCHDFIYMFHMPLFFFLAGYCFKDKYLIDFKNFAKKRISGLYVPFMKYSLLFLLLHNLFYSIGFYSDDFGGYMNRSRFCKFFICTFFMFNNEPLVSPLWFVSALFYGYFIFYGIKRISNKNWIGGGILLILTILTIKLSSVQLLFRASYASLFIMSGYVCKSMHLKDKWWFVIIALILVTAGSIVFPTEMPKVDYITFLPYSLCALAGTYLIMKSSNIITKNTKLSLFFSFLGNNTMPILIWHFLSFKIVSFFVVNICNYPDGTIASFPTISGVEYNRFWFIYTVVGIVVPLCGTLALRKIKQSILSVRK